MRRREFITLLGGAAAWPVAARAQPERARRIGFLRAAPPPEHELDAFLRALAERGYVQGRNFVLVPQWGDGNVARLSELAVTLVNQGVDVIVTEGTIVVRAAAAVTTSIPIVTASAADPFFGGLIKNISRPGGNVSLGYSKSFFLTSAGLLFLQRAPSGRCLRQAKMKPQKRSASNTSTSTCRNPKRLIPQ